MPGAGELAALQRWMQTACLTGQLPLDAAQQLHGSPALPPADRLAIYAHGYRERLIATLRAKYPLLRTAAGDDVFDLFALGYLRARPPRSYSLIHYGTDFADYLAATAPPGELEALPAALARLDAMQEVRCG